VLLLKFKWNRDRFVLSNGHACSLLYFLLHLIGHPEFTMDELQRFRQLGSK
jgi:transketolase